MVPPVLGRGAASLLQKVVAISLLIAGFCLANPRQACAQGQQEPTPIVRFEERAIVAEGVSPGGNVVVFVAGRARGEWVPVRVLRRLIVSDDDRDGVIRAELDRPVNFLSIWAVVDISTGAYTITSPAAFPRKQMDVKVRPGFLTAANGHNSKLALFRGFSEVVVVRRGQGAWAASIVEGWTGDEDPPFNGQASFSASNMKPIGQSGPPPDRFLPTDLVIVFDPERVEYFVSGGVGR